VLLPAVMRLAGRHAWWLPGWLERRLPRVELDGEPSRFEGARGSVSVAWASSTSPIAPGPS
jgi:RND superfamily putative drug exporter